MLLTNTQVSKLRKAFANGSSANIKLSKIQLHIIGESGEFLGRPLGRLLKIGLPLMKNVLKPLAKSVLIPLGLTAALATETAIHDIIFGSGTKTLTISNEEVNDIKKIVEPLEEPGLLIKGVSDTIQNEGNEHKDEFLGMFLGTSGASL